jgi:hypothetical protein
LLELEGLLELEALLEATKVDFSSPTPLRPGNVPRPKVHLRQNVRCLRYRLLAGRAHIHVDFHAARHFDDLRGFPGHFGSPCISGRTSALPDKLTRDEKFATKFFVFETLAYLVASQQDVPQFFAWANQKKSGSTVSFPTLAGTGMGSAFQGRGNIG